MTWASFENFSRSSRTSTAWIWTASTPMAAPTVAWQPHRFAVGILRNQFCRTVVPQASTSHLCPNERPQGKEPTQRGTQRFELRWPVCSSTGPKHARALRSDCSSLRWETPPGLRETFQAWRRSGVNASRVHLRYSR